MYLFLETISIITITAGVTAFSLIIQRSYLCMFSFTQDLTVHRLPGGGGGASVVVQWPGHGPLNICTC